MIIRELSTLIATAFLVTFCLDTTAQNQVPKKCDQGHRTQKLYADHPDRVAQMEQDDADLQKFTNQWAATYDENKAAAGPYIIPVVFHILHQNGTENISMEQIESQLQAWNRDYNKRNPDTIDVVDAFSPIIGDIGVEFRLAQIDPNGDPTDGVVRYDTPETDNADIVDQSSRIWPRQSYLNVFTAKYIGGAAGYTFRPGAVNWNPTQDGIMVLHNYVGSIGTSSPGNQHTLTHEVGHWLNLKHTWGGTNDPALAANCNDDDDVTDTPNTTGWDFSCPTDGTEITCGSRDNIQNYMDYAGCDRMFTEGQGVRMLAALESGTADREDLWTTANLQETGVDQLFEADFYTDYQIVCEGQTIDFSDYSKYGETSWTWTFEGGAPGTSSDEYQTVWYPNTGVYDASLSVSNGSSTESKVKSNHVFVAAQTGNYTPYTDNLETVTSLPTNDYFVMNPDEDNYKWVSTTNASLSGATSFYMKNYNNEAGLKDAIVMQSLDLSPLSSATLTFYVAYAQRTGTENDQLAVYTSTDCGQSWTPKWAQMGAALATVPATNGLFYAGVSSEWKQVTIANITASSISEHTLIKFEFTSAGGNNCFIDDINVEGVWNTKPVLHYPEDLGIGVADDVVLDWKSVQDVDLYELEVDIDNSFSNPVITESKTYIDVDPYGTDTEHETSGLTFDETYYWRVRSKTGAAYSSWSDTWSFTVSADGEHISTEDIQKEKTSFKIYPNPTSGSALVDISVVTDGLISLQAVDVLGRQTFIIDSVYLSKGRHTISLNKEIQNSGMYFIILQAGEQSQTSKLIVK